MISLQSVTDLYVDLLRQYDEYEIGSEELHYGRKVLLKLVRSIFDEESFNTWMDAIEEYERTTYEQV